MSTTGDWTVFVEPDDAARRIRAYIRDHPDIRKGRYATADDALFGSCYVAAEAYWHADGGRESDLAVNCLSWTDVDKTSEGTHWFLSHGGEIIDLSLPTPAHGDRIPWGRARTRVFITGYTPSERTRQVLDALDYEHDH
jgi:hypothetical protein